MADDKKASGIGDTGLFGDTIDMATFEQILEMDEDDEEKEFSKGIVSDFFQQAGTTFAQMDEAIAKEDLGKLSDLGHFLKGSSATLGLNQVKDSCEKIQHWGLARDEHGDVDIDKDEALRLIKRTIPQVKAECAVAERLLDTFYGGLDKA